MKPVFCAALACLSLGLAACGKDAEEPIESAPIAQLQGPWQMINRSAGCDKNYTLISPNAIVRVYDNGGRKKYVTIKKFTLEAGKVTLLTTGLASDPEKELSLVFSVAERNLRLLDIRSDAVASFKDPAKTLDAADQASVKNFYRLNEMRFAMDKCVGA